MGAEILGIGAAAGLAGGAVAGARGTPDQVTTQYGNQSGTSQTTLNPLSGEQQQLQQNSLQNYMRQLALAQQYEQNLGGAQDLQNQAQTQYGNVLSGKAFQASPQQQALIQQQRDSSVQQSTADINRLLDERLGQLGVQAGARGLRGQAYSQLQGDTVRTAAEQYGNTVRGADSAAAQQSLQMPYQTVAAQSPYIQNGMNFADSMNLQAQQNRMTAQNPYLLQLLQNERLQTGLTSNTGNSSGQTVGKGEEGSFWGAVQGGLMGLGGGLGTGASAANAMNRPKYPGMV